jgi:hypothetical protein
MLVHCHGRITVETECLQAETGNMLWLVKGADGKTLQEEEGVILRMIYAVGLANEFSGAPLLAMSKQPW